MIGGLAALGLAAAPRARTTPRAALSDDYAAIRARMLAALPYERITVPGDRALAQWETLRKAGRGTPVIVGSDGDLERIADQFSMGDPAVHGVGSPFPAPRAPADILRAAEALRFPTSLDRWPGAHSREDLAAVEGEWPDDPDIIGPGFTIATDAPGGSFFERVHILLVPARASWEIPAWLRWGDWNACPPPEYHVAALRHWHRRHGAELVGLSGDTMNIHASQRPQRRDTALALARDMYRYCPDIVDQGTGALAPLAATLLADPWWSFWWD